MRIARKSSLAKAAKESDQLKIRVAKHQKKPSFPPFTQVLTHHSPHLRMTRGSKKTRVVSFFSLSLTRLIHHRQKWVPAVEYPSPADGVATPDKTHNPILELFHAKSSCLPVVPGIRIRGTSSPFSCSCALKHTCDQKSGWPCAEWLSMPGA